MKIIFKTNVDKYQTNCWPQNLEMPPRIGESVMVTEVFVDYYQKQGLPVRMHVVDVTWTDKGVVCELCYKLIDIEQAKAQGVNCFNNHDSQNIHTRHLKAI